LCMAAAAYRSVSAAIIDMALSCSKRAVK
jgi:hypothetical protein